jgi:dihydroneopterin aldolase
MDTIHLRLQTECIVGILDRERVTPQPLEIEVAMELDLEQCGRRGDLDLSVNYASVDGALRFLTTEGRFRLIESLSVASLRWLLLPPGPDETRAPIDRVHIRFDKPTVMPDACPGVSMTREALWCRPRQAPLAPGCRADVLVEVREVQAYRVVREPGTPWPEGAIWEASDRVALLVRTSGA